MHSKRGVRAVSIILALAAALFSLSGCVQAGKGKVVAYDLAFEPLNLDPQIASDASSLLVIGNVFEGLVRIDDTGQVIPGIAASHSVSADGREYTFQLNPNAGWSDGEKVKAQDFVFALHRVFDPSTASPGAKIFENIENAPQVYAGSIPADQLGVTAKDDHTVVFRLSVPDTGFLKLLTSASAMPCREDFFLETGGKYGLERVSLLYNGPFKIASWVHGQTVYLTQNSHYVTAPVSPSAVQLSIVPENASRVSRFEKKETDVAALGQSELDRLGDSVQTQVLEDTVWALGFNLNDPVYKDQSLRKALSLCFEKQSYADSLSKLYSVASSLVPPSVTTAGQSYASQAGDPFSLPYDPAQARTLFSDYLKANKLDKLPKTTILVPQTDRHRYHISYIQQIWQKELGAFINLEILPQNELLKRVEEGSFQLALFPLKAEFDSPAAILSCFSSGNARNYIRYANADFDHLLQQAGSTVSEQDAASLYMQGERLLADQWAVLPMYFQSSVFAYQNGVSGLHFSAFGDQLRFADALKK